jgi:trans-2,3-dihydro-3-hydroxyanthranilate isomerase
VSARARPLVWLDVFTATPLTGNGLAVVHDADDLSLDTMLAFARETQLSETTFVQSATEDGADYRNRICMTTRELPFAGHPSIGTAVAVALLRGDREARYVQQTGAGLQPIDVRWRDDRVAWASMLQEPVAFGVEVDAAEVLGAVGLPASAAAAGLPPQVVSTGVTQLIVPVQGRLDDLAPDPVRIRALLDAHDAVTVYLAAGNLQAGEADCRSFFADDRGIAEDPATGSAAGPLMAYLEARAGVTHLDIRQGIRLGRPSQLHCEVHGDRVRVGGDVVVLAQGTITL